MFGNNTLEVAEEMGEALSHDRKLIRAFRTAFKHAYTQYKHELVFLVGKPNLGEHATETFARSWDNLVHARTLNALQRSSFVGLSFGALMAGIEFGVCATTSYNNAQILRNVRFIADEVENYPFSAKLLLLLKKRIDRIPAKGLADAQLRTINQIVGRFR